MQLIFGASLLESVSEIDWLFAIEVSKVCLWRGRVDSNFGCVWKTLFCASVVLVAKKRQIELRLMQISHSLTDTMFDAELLSIGGVSLFGLDRKWNLLLPLYCPFSLPPRVASLHGPSSLLGTFVTKQPSNALKKQHVQVKQKMQRRLNHTRFAVIISYIP